MDIESWPSNKPVPYARNARKLSPQAVDKVAASGGMVISSRSGEPLPSIRRNRNPSAGFDIGKGPVPGATFKQKAAGRA